MISHYCCMATKSNEINGYLWISRLDRLILQFRLKFWHARYCNVTTLPASTNQYRQAVLDQFFVHKLEFWLNVNHSSSDSWIKLNGLLKFRSNFWTHKTFVPVVEPIFPGNDSKFLHRYFARNSTPLSLDFSNQTGASKLTTASVFKTRILTLRKITNIRIQLFFVYIIITIIYMPISTTIKRHNWHHHPTPT